MLDSRHIQTFHEVVRSGSYSAAARSLGCTQPAVSQQMRSLERAVGTPLFTRSGRTLRLTEAGELLSRHAEVILGDLRSAAQQVAAIRRLAAGRVRLCTFPSACATIVASAVTHLRATNPGIRVQLLEAEPPDSLAMVPAGDCEIALAFSYDLSAPTEREDLAVTPLLDDEMVVVLPASHPLTRRRALEVGELADETWIAGCPRCRATFVEACAGAGFTPDIAFTTDDNLAMQSLVVAGSGIAVMPSLVLSFLRHPRLVARPLRPAVHRAVAAYTLPEYLHVPATATMLAALRHTSTQLRPGRPGVHGTPTYN
ncbi:LysR family transcriptional regulator [Pseudonocardia acaciae]|uniref:LysR family transcriptional regulator n=1 Tax=Pseudonocardia acaciae TaxID=551276 RepID=UPI000684AA38|nr:LysR family transcriptional regulator [Pseudonocardia acaciae]